MEERKKNKFSQFKENIVDAHGFKEIIFILKQRHKNKSGI